MELATLIVTMLQDAEKRGESRHEKVMEKLDSIEKIQQGHEVRLVVVENTRAQIKWLVRTGIVGFLTFLGDLAINHVPHWIRRR